MNSKNKFSSGFRQSSDTATAGLMTVSYDDSSSADLIGYQNAYSPYALDVVGPLVSVPEGLSFFAKLFDYHVISVNSGAGSPFLLFNQDDNNPATLNAGDAITSTSVFALDQTSISAEGALGNAVKYVEGASKVLGYAGLALDAGVAVIEGLEAGSGKNPNFTVTEQKFISSAPGLIFGAAALFLAPEGVLGYGLSLALGATGSLLGSTVEASIQEFLLAAPSGSVGGYFDSLLGPIGELREALVKGVNFANNALSFISNAPSPGSLFSQLQAISTSNTQLLSDYRQQTLAEFNSLQYTDNILNQIANAESVINPGEAVVIGLTEALIAKYAISLVNAYVTNSGILSNIIKAEQATQTTLIADVNLLTKDPTNAGALNSGYIALGTLTAATATAVQQLLELDKSINPNNLTAGNYGELISNTSVNGTIQGATTGADLLIGTTAAEVFDGLGSTGNNNPGTDVVIGGGGADTFIFNQGYGSLEISEDDPSGTSSAVLQLGAGITDAMVKVTSAAEGGVLLTIGTNGDNILIDGEQAGLEYGVTAVKFNDGTSLTRSQLESLATAPTTGPDNLYGTSNGATYNGLGGGDTITSTGDNDTYIFDRGYGYLEINATDKAPAPTSQLVFGAGIVSTDIVVTADQSGDLILTVQSGGSANGDVVQIDYELAGNGYGVQTVVFSNGVTWTHSQLLQYAAVATNGANDLYLSAPTTIDGLGGGDTIHGSGGADTFIYKAGYGSLEINERAAAGASTATLQLATGLTLGTATVTGDSRGDILLHFSATDVVQIDQALLGTSYGIGKVTDSTGATLTAAQIIADELNGAAGSLTLYGTSGADNFTNLGHGDIAVGNAGSDVFNYAAGAGALDIQQFDTNAADSNVLDLAGISSTQVTFSVVNQTFGKGILITDGTTGDAIGFTTDASSVIALLPAEGYNSLSSVLAALVSDGHGGSFLALGGTGGTGIDFSGVSVAALTSFANSGTHFAFDTMFPNGWH